MKFPNVRSGVRLTDIGANVRSSLNAGEAETRTWVEWMSVDMILLSRSLASQCASSRLARSLEEAAVLADGKGVLTRLQFFGVAISKTVDEFEDPLFQDLAHHKSDIVRQWCVYAVNDKLRDRSIHERLEATLAFSADHNMTVRECAWMAFRPHLIAQLCDGLKLLETPAKNSDANLRRFSLEVSRPRSVWGTHITALKADPQTALPILELVMSDESDYVRRAAGNWLNDASKSA